MPALSLERMTEFAGTIPSRGTYPIAANVQIFKGAIVGIDSSGRAVPGDTIANGCAKVVGKASASYDNRTGSALGGSAAAVDVEVEYGVFEYVSASGGGDDIAADDVGKVVFVVDDQTVALTSDTDTRAIAGLVTEVRDSKVFVWMGPHVAAMLVIAASEASQLDTAQTEIDELQADALTAQAMVSIPLAACTLAANGAPLIVFNDGVADGLDFSEGQSYRFNPNASAAIGVTVPMPQDLDDAEDVVVHILASRVGAADTTAAVTVAAFFQTVGAAHDADADAGGATGAIAGATTVVHELTRTIAAADVPAAPCALSLTLLPTAALDADDMRIHAVWLEYTRKLLTA